MGSSSGSCLYRRPTLVILLGLATLLCYETPVDTALTSGAASLVFGAADQAELRAEGLGRSPSVPLISATGRVVIEPDIAYDPINGVHLVVFTMDDKGPWGLYLNANGQKLSDANDGQAGDVGDSNDQDLPFRIATGYGKYPRVTARTGGTGGFLVTYGISNQRQAVFVRPSGPTLGPIVLGSTGPYVEWDGGGAAYLPDYDRFLVTFQSGTGSRTDIIGAPIFSSSSYTSGISKGTNVQLSSNSGQCSGSEEHLRGPEVAWDVNSDRAYVVGYRDKSSCDPGSGGGIWRRLVAFNGTTISPQGSSGFLSTGGWHWDPQVQFSQDDGKFVVVWSKDIGSTRPVFKQAVSTNGSPDPIRLILPANLTNGSPKDDYFGRDNQIDLEYNGSTGRFVLGMRGDDGGAGGAPAYVLELNSAGDAVPRTLSELLEDTARPYIRFAARANQFIALTKYPGETNLSTQIVSASGATGSGVWPTTSGSDAGGGGGGGGGQPSPPPPPPPQPPPPSGTATLAIVRPTGGTIIGSGISCGTTATTCVVTEPIGTRITLYAVGGTLTNWGGCASSFVLSASRTCTPTFSGGSSSGGGGGGGSTVSLTVVNPGAGGGGGSVIWVDQGVVSPGQSLTRSGTSPMRATLYPIPKTGFVFGGWVGAGCASAMSVTTTRTCTADFNAK